jgi:PAS domain S-box-containing protein
VFFRQLEDFSMTEKPTYEALEQRVEKLEKQTVLSNESERAVWACIRFLEIANKHMEMAPLLQGFLKETMTLTGCSAVGIRLLDDDGNIPYEAYEGFSPEFYESESPLSIKTDRCMCINVITGSTNSKLPFFTEMGSFFMNGTTAFLDTVLEEQKGQTRNMCNQAGYESVALIPIRSGRRILGLIHVADCREDKVPLEVVGTLELIGMQLGAGIERVWAEEGLRIVKEELESKVTERTASLSTANEQLQLEIEERKQAEEALKEEAIRRRILVEQSRDGIVVLDQNGKVYEANQQYADMLGYSMEEALQLRVWDWDTQWTREQLIEMLRTVNEIGDHFETRHRRKDGTFYDVEISTNGAMCGGQKLVFCVCRDITRRKQAEEALKRKEAQLRAQAHHLEETNTALKVLIQHRDKEKEELEQNILANVRKMVLPYLEKLTDGVKKPENKTYLEIVQSHLVDLVSPFARKVSAEHFGFSPTELKVADFVRHGKTSKDIASLLCVSQSTVLFHRKNIRKKLGLAKKRVNLRAYLESFPKKMGG